MVANCRDEEFVRAKRHVINLPNAYNDVRRHEEGNWKWQNKYKCQFGGSREKFKARSLEL